MAKALLALLVAAAVLMVLAWQSGVWSEPVEVCEIDKQTRERLCVVHNAVLGTLIRVGRFLQQHSEALIAAFTIILTISIILLWIATHRLQKSIAAVHQAGERQIAIAQQSADAATKAAMAAEASVKTMTDISQKQLQVYGSVQAALVELLEPPSGPSHSHQRPDHRPDPAI